jgi:hypothetical protein
MVLKKEAFDKSIRCSGARRRGVISSPESRVEAEYVPESSFSTALQTIL